MAKMKNSNYLGLYEKVYVTFISAQSFQSFQYIVNIVMVPLIIILYINIVIVPLLQRSSYKPKTMLRLANIKNLLDIYSINI